jgi:hypothetical protein
MCLLVGFCLYTKLHRKSQKKLYTIRYPIALKQQFLLSVALLSLYPSWSSLVPGLDSYFQFAILGSVPLVVSLA